MLSDKTKLQEADIKTQAVSVFFSLMCIFIQIL